MGNSLAVSHKHACESLGSSGSFRSVANRKPKLQWANSWGYRSAIRHNRCLSAVSYCVTFSISLSPLLNGKLSFYHKNGCSAFPDNLFRNRAEENFLEVAQTVGSDDESRDILLLLNPQDFSYGYAGFDTERNFQPRFC